MKKMKKNHPAIGGTMAFRKPGYFFKVPLRSQDHQAAIVDVQGDDLAHFQGWHRLKKAERMGKWWETWVKN